MSTKLKKTRVAQQEARLSIPVQSKIDKLYGLVDDILDGISSFENSISSPERRQSKNAKNDTLIDILDVTGAQSMRSDVGNRFKICRPLETSTNLKRLQNQLMKDYVMLSTIAMMSEH